MKDSLLTSESLIAQLRAVNGQIIEVDAGPLRHTFTAMLPHQRQISALMFIALQGQKALTQVSVIENADKTIRTYRLTPPQG